MCNCEEETKRTILEKYPHMDDVINDNELVSLDTFGPVYCNSYTARRKYLTKSGKERTENKKVNRSHKYCPFCGEKLEEN
ncbi:hypothetical protein [Metaclostridioides mangenotii]|uniref:hypothetical protein n=1 Tax=Metaclostridioides mangenotii TaxID=1540 RepID=UPI0028EA1AA5|nr:hypothetical protein [Clostridioides mangenotii]